MMNSKKLIALSVAAAAGMTASLTCVGATESMGSFARIEGSAVVSQGAQYVKAYEGMPLNAGDRLMVMDGGKAILSFKDGCQYTVGDNEILTVGATSACAAQGAGSYKVEPRSAVAQNAGKGSALSLRPAAVGGAVIPATIGGVSTTAAAIGVVAVVGGAVAVSASSDDNNDSPASP